MDADVAGVIEAIGPRLRALRKSRGLTLAHLAEQTGLSISALSRAETGRRQPTLDLLIPLARAHRVALERLIAAPPPAIRASTSNPAGTAAAGWWCR